MERWQIVHARIREIERQGFTVSADEIQGTHTTSFQVTIRSESGVTVAYSKHANRFDWEAAFAAFDDPNRTAKRHPYTDRQNITIRRKSAA